MCRVSMLTLEDINNEAYFLWRKSQVEAMRTPRLGKIHVSDLTMAMLGL